MRAGCYVKLPRDITMKKAMINVQSMDNACFAWSVVAALYSAEQHVDRTISYPFLLYVGTESPGYTVSNNTERHYQI